MSQRSTTGTPRWVKLFGIIILVLLLLVAVMMLGGGGNHGPGRHMPSGETGSYTPRSSIVDDHTT